MTRCKWVVPTPKVEGKYSAAPCEILRWSKNDQPVMCNGWKSACLGKWREVYDIRDKEPHEIEILDQV